MPPESPVPGSPADWLRHAYKVIDLRLQDATDFSPMAEEDFSKRAGQGDRL
jgi:hypothetical protein